MMSGCFFSCSEAAYSSFGPAQQPSSWCPPYQIIRTSGKSTFSIHRTKSMYSCSKIIIHSLFSISWKGHSQNGSSVCIIEISHLTSQFFSGEIIVSYLRLPHRNCWYLISTKNRSPWVYQSNAQLLLFCPVSYWILAVLRSKPSSQWPKQSKLQMKNAFAY